MSTAHQRDWMPPLRNGSAPVHEGQRTNIACVPVGSIVPPEQVDDLGEDWQVRRDGVGVDGDDDVGLLDWRMET